MKDQELDVALRSTPYRYPTRFILFEGLAQFVGLIAIMFMFSGLEQIVPNFDFGASQVVKSTIIVTTAIVVTGLLGNLFRPILAKFGLVPMDKYAVLPFRFSLWAFVCIVGAFALVNKQMIVGAVLILLGVSIPAFYAYSRNRASTAFILQTQKD
jgi:hypothetical protein